MLLRGLHDAFQYRPRTTALTIDERGKEKLPRIRVYDRGGIFTLLSQKVNKVK